MTRARAFHGLTAVVAVAGLVLQLMLVLQGGRVLDEVRPPATGQRVYRFFAYFTVQSNLLVAWAAATLWLDPGRDGPRWRVLRLAGTAGITVTAVVHFVLLRPLLDLHGWDRVADTVLHLVVPTLAVLGWVLFGPRPRVDLRTLGGALLHPLVWVVWTMAFGAVDGWYPYPFLDPDQEGWTAVVVALLAITAFVVGVLAAYRWLDGRLRPAGVVTDVRQGRTADPPAERP
ncbi:Pr6Pr family membrane protein [Nocardioides sp. SYSU D00038]|uniref:Pr6Pr family membrane protein n=1 Tax=Nocardioides sp. SYSU D00038 TaxID=2812554 RepID=UPI001967B727|nr:Pr6Pr family membrane protein [Nocardioides sp. SYSU D00038]